MKTGIRYYTQAAMLVALCIVIRRFLTPQGMGINLGGLPIILGGFILGPAGGALVGAVSDIVGCVFSHQPYTVLITITSALTGAIPPAVLLLFTPAERRQWWAIGAAIAVGQLITKVWLLPCFLNLAFGYHIKAVLIRNLVEQSWHIPLYTFLTVPILKAYRASTGQDPIPEQPKSDGIKI